MAILVRAANKNVIKSCSLSVSAVTIKRKLAVLIREITSGRVAAETRPGGGGACLFSFHLTDN